MTENPSGNRRIDLCGKWTMRHFLEGELTVNSPLELAQLHQIPATVPGNYEIDLMAAGQLEDPFFGTNSTRLRPLEFHQWWYEKHFKTPDFLKTNLVFEGLDCIADIWLNGEKIASTANALIPHKINISDSMRPEGEENDLFVCLKSPLNAIRDCGIEPSMRGHGFGQEMLRLRKPAHCFGWDIMPRIVSAGIWRPVYLEEVPSDEITDTYIVTEFLDENSARMRLWYSFRTSALVIQDMELLVTGKCGDHEFEVKRPVINYWDQFTFEVRNPRLWWPRGYGEANLYDVTVSLIHKGNINATRKLTLGIRTIVLDNTELNTPEHPGRFNFIVNNVPVFIKGSNWVPADALHSRDAERIPKLLELFSEMGCNMARCWGGNVYEPQLFYDICDKEGIMVWQDFSMACGAYPQDQDFLDNFTKEAEIVVRERRQHPSIVLWAGDNECDCGFAGWWGIYKDPGKNRITREVLPRVIDRLDCFRPYIPSSPYITPAIAALKGNERMGPEQHLWGIRDYYKTPFYANNNACFASEMGYHGCPSVESLKRFISPENLWPWQNNPEWGIHATDPIPGISRLDGRITMMAKQIQEMFGDIPDNIQDFALASQFVQAEAKKYFVELFRQRKPHTGGILWWNMIDGWPEISDAVVDYYFTKKLAFHFLKRVHRPLCMIMCEPEAWNCRVIMCNDSLINRQGHFKVMKGEAREIVLEGDFNAPANRNITLGSLRTPRSDKELYIMEWEADGGEHNFNHYLFGSPAFDLDTCKRWLKIIKDVEPFEWSC